MFILAVQKEEDENVTAFIRNSSRLTQAQQSKINSNFQPLLFHHPGNFLSLASFITATFYSLK